MWTNENRARYNRSKLRYPSDLADAEWAIIAPLIPPAKRGGNKRPVVEREIVNGLLYILSTGCQWASLPKDLPPRSTVNDYFCRWNSDGTLDRIQHALYVRCRELAEREASPTAAIIDSQSVKSAEKGGGPHRSVGLRRWQEDQRQEAPCPGRYARSAAVRHRACRRHPGPRRRRDADERAVRPVSIPSEAVCRQRLSGTQIPAGAEARPRSDQRGNREAVRPWQIHRAAQALDRRTVDGLAQPVPPPGQRLGMSQPERSGISTLGVHPADGQKALSDHHMSPDGLIDSLPRHAA